MSYRRIVFQCRYIKRVAMITGLDEADVALNYGKRFAKFWYGLTREII